MNSGKTFEDKIKFIEKISNELDTSISTMSQKLAYSLISEFVDRLERDGDIIKNTPGNIRLISQIDSIYQSFINKNGAKLVNNIISEVDGIFDYNNKYFASVTGKANTAVAKKVTGIIRDRLGVNEGSKVKLKEGGYMDMLLQDTKVRNDIKQLSYREVLKGSGFKNFKKAIESFIIGDEERLGAFKQHYRQYSYDIYATIDRDSSKLMADELDLKYFIYEGTLVKKSREFCIDRVGKVYSVEEAKLWVNDEWIKKNLERGYITSYNPVTDMGLFGCRHLPRFITYEQAVRLRPDLAQKEPLNPGKKEKQPIRNTDVQYKPNGNKIESQFTKFDKKVERLSKSALEAIDLVHGDGDLDDIPFKTTSSDKYNAAFYHSVKGQPIKIAISKKGDALSVAHEMAHYFDLHVIGGRGKFETEQKDSLLKDFLQVAKKSQAIKSIETILKDKKVSIGDQEITIGTRNERFFKYMMDPKEIWARAYSQFIAKRSGSKEMAQALKSSQDGYKTRGYKYQWDDDDFEEIEKEIEALMLKIGWISQ